MIASLSRRRNMSAPRASRSQRGTSLLAYRRGERCLVGAGLRWRQVLREPQQCAPGGVVVAVRQLRAEPADVVGPCAGLRGGGEDLDAASVVNAAPVARVAR